MGTNEEFIEEEWNDGWSVQHALYVIAILMARFLDKDKKIGSRGKIY